MNKRIKRWVGLVATTVTAVSTVVLGTTAPAAAFSQYCGEGMIGIDLGGYPDGTSDTGHPEGDTELASWGGTGAIGAAKDIAFGIDRASAFVSWSNTLYGVLDYDEPNKIVKLGFSVAALALDIAAIPADLAVMRAEQSTSEMDACSGVFNGDLMDVMVLARMQEELAGLDPANGPIDVPSNVFALPDDGAPEWTSDTTKYDDRGTHADLTIPYLDGSIDNEYVGAAVMVRNLIAHMEAHGMNTGGGTIWVSGTGLVRQDGAKDLWWDGMRLLEDGRVRLAYAKFADAYRMAVSTHTSS